MINRITEELLVAAGRRPASSIPAQATQDDDGIAEQAKQWAAEFEEVFATHPGASLAVALGLGMVIGWLVKRS